MNTAIATANPFSSLIVAFKNRFFNPVKEKQSVEAYDLWAENYDAQPGNLMLDMDEKVFVELLSEISIEGKQVADIGCGTGRHWPKMFDANQQALQVLMYLPGC